MGGKIEWFKKKMGRDAASRTAKRDQEIASEGGFQAFDRYKALSQEFAVLLGKVDEALRLLIEVVPVTTGSISETEQANRTSWAQQKAALDKSKDTNIRDANRRLQALVDLLPAEYTRIRRAAKAKPYSTTVSIGGQPRNVKVYGADIPGFYDAATDAERQELVKKVAPKIARGKDKLNAVLAGNPGAPATASDVTDLMWAMKNIGQENADAAWDKGAMSVEDDGEKIRKYLDSCSDEIYFRSSSHFVEQQQRDGQQSRGMDFYEGTAGETGIADAARLLPTGMNTLTYQTMTAPNGKKVVYLKMETQGAYKTSPAHRRGIETMASRPQRDGDVVHSIKHGGNFLATKLGKGHSDKDLRAFREEVPGDIKEQMKALVAMFAKNKNKTAVNALKASMGTGKNAVGKSTPVFRINTFVAALDRLYKNDAISADEQGAVDAFLALVDQKYPDAPLRGGGEVVITAQQLA